MEETMKQVAIDNGADDDDQVESVESMSHDTQDDVERALASMDTSEDGSY